MLNRLVGILQLGKLRFDFVTVADHLRHRCAVLAVQPAQQIEAALHPLGVLLIEVHLLAQRGQLADGVLHLVIQPVKPRIHGLIAVVKRGNRRDGIDALPKLLHNGGAVLAAAAQQRAGLVKRTHDLPRIAVEDLLPLELLLLVGLQARALQLLELKAQHVDALLALGDAPAQAGELLSGAAPLLVELRATLQQRTDLVRRVVVQIPQVVAAVQQQLVLVLAMDIEQLCGNLPQRLQRHHSAVDAADVLARAGQLAGDGRRVLIPGERQLIEQRAHTLVVRDIEHSLHPGFALSVGDEIAVRALAQHQVHRVHDDGLARTGLAGEHVHARGEVERHFVDQRQIVYAQLQQHRLSSCFSG